MPGSKFEIFCTHLAAWAVAAWHLLMRIEKQEANQTSTLLWAEFNNLQQVNENFDHRTTPQQEGVVKTEDDISLDGIFLPCVQCTPPLVGPTLVRLGNVRKNAIRKLAQHHMVVWNNRIFHSKTMQLNILYPRSVDNNATDVLKGRG